MILKSFLENLWKYILYLTVAFTAIFTLSFFSSPFIISKIVFLTLAVGAGIVIFVLGQMLGTKFSFSFGKFDLGVFLFGTVYMASAIIKTPNQMEAFFSPGAVTFVLSAVLIYFLANQLSASGKEGFKFALISSGIFLSISILFTQIGFFSKIPQLPAFVKDANFNPLGGAIPSLILLSSLVPFVLGMFLNQKDLAKKAFLGISAILIIFGLTVSIVQALPGKATSPKLTSTQVSWEVAVEVIKKSPLLGIGPANYLTAFNLFRPVSYNSTDLWATRFTTARNFYMTYATETGILGIFALIVLFSSLYRHFRKQIKSNRSFTLLIERSSIVVFLILLGFFPGALVLIVFLFALLAVFSGSEEKGQTEFNIHPSFLGVPVLIGVSLIIFYGVKIVSAETKFKGSLDALSKNDAKKTYDLMREAIKINPKIDVYHSSSAQINIALATSIANKKELSDDDKKMIAELIQQAIAEGKAMVSLNPQRSGNWEILAITYRSIMPFAQGADNFAIQTFTQAVSLDPTNPNLRIALGGTYYALGRFDEAVDAFKLAVLAKPDLANAHYNLAAAFREKNDYDNAIARMNIVLSLVKKDSPDYTLAKTELDNLEKNKLAKTTQGTENLTPPQPAGTSNIKPPIELPKEATPEIPQDAAAPIPTE
ncbi:MAG: tetratricopeptide repeat protein [bacterium]|nr:tetratricopeptide repeat protein [bacterium]